MVQNPLQRYFRQPKIFLKLPSLGVYNDATTIQGNVENLPIYGMTGMDQIIAKTPDALISGESTVRIIESCCPSFNDAWQVASIDIDSMLVAIRIATYGDNYNVMHKCPSCSEINEFGINLTSFIDYFNGCNYDSKIVFGDLIIRIKPLTYKKATEFNLEHFSLQKQMIHIDEIDDQEQKKQLLSSIFKQLGELQNKIFVAGIESVATPSETVSEWSFIKEWIDNCDSEIMDMLKAQFDKNNSVWRIPPTDVKCLSCGHEDTITIDMDQSSFFAKA